MKMLAVFGQLLRSVKGKLKKQDDNLGTMATGKVNQTPETTNFKTLIWGVMDGPYNIEDFPEDDLDFMGIEEGYEWMLVCKIEEDGAIGLANFWYQTLDEALSVKHYFDSNIEPLELDSD